MNAFSFLCSSLTNSVWVYSIITKIYILLKLVGSKNQNTFSLTIIMNSPVRGASERAAEICYQTRREDCLRMIGRRAGTNRAGMRRDDSILTRFVDSVFSLFRLAEFEILFVLFFVIAYVIFKDLTARPEYNRILVEKPGGWPF